MNLVPMGKRPAADRSSTALMSLLIVGAAILMSAIGLTVIVGGRRRRRDNYRPLLRSGGEW